MLITSRTAQAGFSLIEFMIGSTVGLIVLTGALSMHTVSVRANTSNLDMASVNQDLRSTIRLVVLDIRRAGYWAGVPGLDDMTENPFQSDGNDLTIADIGGVPDSCVTYAYDLDKNKTVGNGTAGTTMENLGFRLLGGAVQSRTGGVDFSCADGAWQDFTSTTTEITQLNFNLTEICVNLDTEVAGCPCNSGDPCQHIRQVDITVGGRSRRDDQIQGTITESVRLRNDKFVASAP